jgi:hypothetical protein
MAQQDQMRNGPAFAANVANNAKGDGARHRRWAPARAAAWALLDGLVAEGAHVAVVGAGNGDDVPLASLARRAARLDLIDLDGGALSGARRHVGVAHRRTVRQLEEDVTGGAADAVVAAALARAPAPDPPPTVPAEPVGDGPYDVVVCDLVLTQLLYPALRSGDLTGAEIDAVLLRDGQRLTDGVVARLHAAAPGGTVVLLHDILGWWKGHQQPFTLDELLARGREDPDRALALARGGSLPYGCDPWLATRAAGARILETRIWRWPFAPGAEYGVFALVTRRQRRPAGGPRPNGQGGAGRTVSWTAHPVSTRECGCEAAPMVVSLLPKSEARQPEDHRFALPTVLPLPRPPVPAAPRTW